MFLRELRHLNGPPCCYGFYMTNDFTMLFYLLYEEKIGICESALKNGFTKWDSLICALGSDSSFHGNHF